MPIKGGDWGRPTHVQGQAFMVARVSGVEFVAAKKPGRFIIRFESYAEIHIPSFWPGLRNPVHYMTLEETGIDVDKLTVYADREPL